MSGRKMSGVWVPVDPELVRDKLRRSGLASVYYIDDCQEDLRRQGYRFNAAQLAELRAITDEYCKRWYELVESMAIEHVGPPLGKVAPPEAAECYRLTGKYLVTDDDDDPPGESRSRH